MRIIFLYTAIFCFIFLFFSIKPSYAQSSCICQAAGVTPDYGDPSNKDAWCSCAQSCNDTGSYQNGPSSALGSCAAASSQNTCAAGVCGKCATTNTCGNTTYDRCDTSPCTAAGATANTTFKCWASESPNSCSFSENLCGSCAPQKICTPDKIDGPPHCAQCNSAGTAYTNKDGSYFPGSLGSAEWCACAKQYSDPGYYNQNCGSKVTPAPNPTSTPTRAPAATAQAAASTSPVSGTSVTVTGITINGESLTPQTGSSLKLTLPELIKTSDVTSKIDVTYSDGSAKSFFLTFHYVAPQPSPTLSPSTNPTTQPSASPVASTTPAPTAAATTRPTVSPTPLPSKSPYDLTGDGVVNSFDPPQFILIWKQGCTKQLDFDLNGVCNALDYGILKNNINR